MTFLVSELRANAKVLETPRETGSPVDEISLRHEIRLGRSASRSSSDSTVFHVAQPVRDIERAALRRRLAWGVPILDVDHSAVSDEVGAGEVAREHLCMPGVAAVLRAQA